MGKVLVVSPDVIPSGKGLVAGPGIRSWGLAKGLDAHGHDVTLAVPEESFIKQEIDEFEVVSWNLRNLNKLSSGNDCVVLPSGLASLSRAYARTVSQRTPTVVDVYDPNIMEAIHIFKGNLRGFQAFSEYLNAVTVILRRGDFFICASERQRYYYLGVLTALGRINPLTSNERLVELVPFGVPAEEPKHTRNVLKGSIVDAQDPIILWMGGIYPWFDAITLIRAMKLVCSDIGNAKLIVVGGIHPRLHAPADNYYRTLREARRSNLFNKNVFFVDWQPYDQISNYFLESDVAVSTHSEGLEAKFSFRTRVIQYLWGGLPVVVSEGDEMASLVSEQECGLVVPVADSAKLATAILDLLCDGSKRRKMSSNARRLIQERFVWEKVVTSLSNFCSNPICAGDRKQESSSTRPMFDDQVSHKNEDYCASGGGLKAFLANLLMIQKEAGLQECFAALSERIRQASRKQR